MKNLKALILASLILVPLLVFVFGLIFGEQHFKLRTYFPVLTHAGGVMYNAEGDTIFRRIPDFEFTSQTGQTITQEALAANGIYVAHFFYTSCPANCQQVSAQLMRVQEMFRNNPQVKLASFTTDAAHDSQQMLHKYAIKYGAAPAQWFFLTGSHEQLYRIATKDFQLPVQQGSNGVFYSDQLILVDKAHRVRGIYDGASTTETDRLVMEINVLLDEYRKRK